MMTAGQIIGGQMTGAMIGGQMTAGAMIASMIPVVTSHGMESSSPTALR